MKGCARLGAFACVMAAASAAAQPVEGTGGAAVAVHAGSLDDTNRLLRAGQPRWVGTAKRIRVYFGGVAVADSTRVHLLRDGGAPVYYFPESDVKREYLVPSPQVRDAPLRGEASYWTLTVGARVAEDAAWTFRTPAAGAEFLKGYIAFEWNKMDHWFEEQDEVFVHARDPYLRIESVRTDRHIRIVLGGVTVAESDDAVMLLEPGHPIRFYLPLADVRAELLRPSATTSRCAYKGLANYYSMEVDGRMHEDVIWSYRAPTLESGKIAGLVSFYNERVDAIFVDGELLPKPRTRVRESR